MRTLTYLIFKYWRKHKKNALALIFSSSMIVAVIFFTLLLVREEFNRSLQSMFDSHGNAEYIVGNSNDELLAYIVGDKTDFDVSSIYVNGEIYAGMDKIPYGTVEDESGIIRIPVKTGRLPEGPDEAAIEEGAAQKLRWLGRVGDTLEIDGKRYTVTGIIDKAYGERKGAPFSFAMQNDHTKYPLPLIFTGQTDSSPIYRIDHLSGLYDASAYEMNYAYANKLMENDEIMNRVLSLYLEQSEQYEAGEEPNWFDWTGGDYRQLSITEHFEYQRKMEGNETGFFLRIFTLGAIVAVLSVFSVLRNIFIERRSRTQILRRIGMSDRRIGAMYAIECFLMIILQTTAGLLFGCAIYGAVFAFRVNVLGYPPYSGFTANSYISVFSPDPFIVSVAASVAIMALAYLITVLTTKAKRKPPRKNVKPRSLSRCFSGIFRQRTVSMIQTAALVLICFSTVFSYMYYTDSGKSAEEGYASFNGGSWDHWSKSTAEYYVDGLDMEAEGIEDYYFADDMPFFGSIESYGNLKNAMYFAPSRYGSGIDDSLADALPNYAVAVGYIENPFIICDEPNSLYSNKIEFFEQDEKNLILQLSDQEYQNFFDEGQLGTKYLYQAKTKLTRASLILSLQQYVKQGEINIDKLNSGEEVIAVVSAGKSPFEAGETLHLGMELTTAAQAAAFPV